MPEDLRLTLTGQVFVYLKVCVDSDILANFKLPVVMSPMSYEQSKVSKAWELCSALTRLFLHLSVHVRDTAEWSQIIKMYVMQLAAAMVKPRW